MVGTNPDNATPNKKVPAYARAGRFLYALLASAFAGCAVAQVFFAGMGAFGVDWDWHTTFVHVLELLPLLMIPAALVGRLSWGLALAPFGLVFLIGVQYATANAVVPAAALHPVNGFLILLLSVVVARRAWATAAGRKKKLSTREHPPRSQHPKGRRNDEPPNEHEMGALGIGRLLPRRGAEA